LAAIGSKLTLLPMFHYDPRRWQAKDNKEAFKNVGPAGIFLGSGVSPLGPPHPEFEGLLRPM
jgi:hypothetical protein